MRLLLLWDRLDGGRARVWVRGEGWGRGVLQRRWMWGGCGRLWLSSEWGGVRDGDVCEGVVGRSLLLLVVRRRGPVMLWWILTSSEFVLVDP